MLCIAFVVFVYFKMIYKRGWIPSGLHLGPPCSNKLKPRIYKTLLHISDDKHLQIGPQCPSCKDKGDAFLPSLALSFFLKLIQGFTITWRSFVHIRVYSPENVQPYIIVDNLPTSVTWLLEPAVLLDNVLGTQFVAQLQKVFVSTE
jgi:hypothetical protein